MKIAAPTLIAVAAIGLVVLSATFTGHRQTASPTHVTAVFLDGVNHGDYRQTCAVWEAASKQMAKCEAGLTVQLAQAALIGDFGGYRAVPHSEKGWRTGAIEYATVKVVHAGQKLTAHLRKRPGGPWLVWFII